jgi:hypothetical protein
MGNKVTLEQLRPDMVLAADIVDGNGRLLLPAGTTVTDKHVRYCQMWGVLEVEIASGEGPPVVTEPVIDPARLAAAEALLRPRFRHVDQAHPVVDILFRHAVQAHLAGHA